MTADVRQLPSGRHGLDPRFVRDNQRDRIVRATADLLVERGYDGCTVSAIIDRARLSRKTFYEFFNSRADVVEAAVEAAGIVGMSTGVPELDRSGWRLTREEAA